MNTCLSCRPATPGSVLKSLLFTAGQRQAQLLATWSGGFNLHIKKTARLSSKHMRNLTMTETQSTPVPSSQRPFLPCPLSPMPSCVQAALSKNMILWTSLTNEQQALPFVYDHTRNTISNCLYFLISEKDPVLRMLFYCRSSHSE